MDRASTLASEPLNSDSELLHACLHARALDATLPLSAEAWSALCLGFASHVARHERYALPRLARRDPKAASGVRERHHALACELEAPLQALDAHALDALIEHLQHDRACMLIAVPRRRGSVTRA